MVNLKFFPDFISNKKSGKNAFFDFAKNPVSYNTVTVSLKTEVVINFFKFKIMANTTQ